MTEEKRIVIKNIYYMLSYAFQVLKQNNYHEIASESFENAQNLFAAILVKGIGQQVKQGLYRSYEVKKETLPVLKGKMDINETIKCRLQKKQTLGCEYDELSKDNILNQILKTTSIILMNEKTVDKTHQTALKKLMLYFADVQTINITSIQWQRLHFHRHNRTYQMLINICYFVIDGLLQTTDKGTWRMAQFSDEHLARLFERFVLEYYKFHHPELNPHAGQIKWNLDDETDGEYIRFLPIMQSDIILQQDDKTLIIDTKFYSRTMQSYYGKQTLHSSNLYQIYTYVKNRDVMQSGDVSGLLLYAKTDEQISPDNKYIMGGNKIFIKTIDLNKVFFEIARELDEFSKIIVR